MSLFTVTKRNVVFATVGTLAALGVGGTAYAATATGSSTSTQPAAGSHARTAHHHRARNLLERTDRATMEVKMKGQWVALSYDRGKVSAVSPTSITLALPDGHSATETITSSTKFHGATSASAVTVGKPAHVFSEGGKAVRVGQRDATAKPTS